MNGFAAIGFHAGEMASAYVIEQDETGAAPILTISNELSWVSVSANDSNGPRANLEFARSLAAAASKYLAAMERHVGRQQTREEVKP